MLPLVRRLFLCACAAGGFAGMAALLHLALPPHVPEVTPKLNYLKAHLGDFDTLFVGSSRIYHGVSPRVFDAVTSGGGKPTHSFNMAINGMMPPESLHLLRTILAMRPPRLRRVFLEVASAEPNPDTNNLTIRDVYAQDYGSLIYGAKRALLDIGNGPRTDRWSRAWDDVSASALTFAQNEFNIGRVDLTTDLAKSPDRLGQVMLGPDKDGYLPVRHPIAPESRVTLERNLEAMRSGKVPERPPDALNAEGYARIRDLLAARGVELVLVVAPLTLKDYHAWVDAPPGPRLLKFDDPQRYPELYVPGHRLDSDHVNDAGAQVFSKELAQAYLSGK